jgi:hypothetical protein
LKGKGIFQKTPEVHIYSLAASDAGKQLSNCSKCVIAKDWNLRGVKLTLFVQRQAPEALGNATFLQRFLAIITCRQHTEKPCSLRLVMTHRK